MPCLTKGMAHRILDKAGAVYHDHGDTHGGHVLKEELKIKDRAPP